MARGLAVLALSLGSAAPGLAQAPRSPRLDRLEQAVQDGSIGALDRFWAELTAVGAPLVEPHPSDPSRRLVTFVWRASEPARDVVVAGSALGGNPAANRLTQMPGTQLWHRTLDLPADLRTVYRFVIDPPEGSTGTRAHARQDPFNPKAFVYPRDPEVEGSTDYRISLLELPAAGAQPWIGEQAGVPRGRVETHRFASRILGNERRVFVYTPAGYEPGAAPYPLLLIFDGAAYLTLVPTPVILDNLIAAGRIPPAVAVLVDNPDAATRSRELDCYSPFVEFVATELTPWIEARYRVSTDPGRRLLGGSSGGGQASICIGEHHPELFGLILAQSGSFFAAPDQPMGDEWVYRHLIERPRLPLRVYLDVGRFEPSFSVTGVRMMRNVLEALGYPLVYQEFSGGHDYSWWRGTLADGLIALLPAQ
ncbi:MAG: alpha/beta hydrolase [Gemmatimonadales bacterium]